MLLYVVVVSLQLLLDCSAFVDHILSLRLLLQLPQLILCTLLVPGYLGYQHSELVKVDVYELPIHLLKGLEFHDELIVGLGECLEDSDVKLRQFLLAIILHQPLNVQIELLVGVDQCLDQMVEIQHPFLDHTGLFQMNIHPLHILPLVLLLMGYGLMDVA